VLLAGRNNKIMNDKYYVIAGDYNQFRVFILRKSMDMYQGGNTSITLSHFVYVSGPETLRGLRNPRGFFVGTWRKKSNIKDILLTLYHQTEEGLTSRKILQRLCNEVL
jgi:hypothetical protein